MKILVFSHYAGSGAHGMVFRNYALAAEWVARGHEVTIIAASYSHTRSNNPAISKSVQEEWIDGIRYLWTWVPSYRANSGVGRVIAMLIYTLHCFRMALTGKHVYDMVMVSSPHPFSIYPARMIARNCKAKLVFDIRDLWPLTLVELGGFKRTHPLVWLLQKAEDYACRHADLVTAVPGNSEGYLKSRGLRANRFIPVGNGAVIEHATPVDLPSQNTDILHSLKMSGKFLVGYAGAVGVANAMHSPIRALAQTESRVHLVILGGGPEVAALKQLAVDIGVGDRVHFLEPVARAAVPQFLALVDSCYVGAMRSSLYKFGASFTKVNDYMLAGKPIVYAVGDSASAVELSGCGVLCEPEMDADIASAFNRLASLSVVENEMLGEKGRAWCMKYQLVSSQAQLIIDSLSR